MTDVSIPYDALPVTRKDAKRQSSKFYFTGKPCVRGHVVLRFTVDGCCQQCKRDDSAAWKKRNVAHVKAYQKAQNSRPEILAKNAARQRVKRAADLDAYNAGRREYRAKNKEKAREWNLAWKAKNRETLRVNALTYYYANLDERRAANRDYAKNNVELYRAINARRRARKMAAPGSYAPADIDAQFKLQAGYCFGCFADLTVVGYHVDHIVPLAKGGTNWPGNLQLLCPTCNCSKGAKDNAEWWAEQIRRRAK